MIVGGPLIPKPLDVVDGLGAVAALLFWHLRMLALGVLERAWESAVRQHVTITADGTLRATREFGDTCAALERE